MSPAALPSLTTTCRIAPGEELASCVRAYMVRSTVGAELATSQRRNHFPATASCSITWFFEGGSKRWPDGEVVPGPVVFRGPQTRPVTSCNPGAVHMLVLLVWPDAMQALSGINPETHVNRLSSVRELLDADWCAMTERVLAAPDDETRVDLIEAFLEPRWRASRPERNERALSFSNWTTELAARSGNSGSGRSSRQVERRVRASSGLSMRTLRGLVRADRCFNAAMAQVATHPRGRVAWADVAVDAGYSDQPHLCRELRRFTGFSPQALLRGIRGDEAFWVYRAWG